MKWISVKDRVPDNRRKVHCWGISGLSIFPNPAPKYIGVSSCNISKDGFKFDIEESNYFNQTVVTHWAEITGPGQE